MRYGLNELNEKYNLELEKILEEIEKQKPKRILLQLPDGLKPYAISITDYLGEKTKTPISIYLGACFGACDIPTTNADLLIQFGHAPWN